jgi:hypothetical protein
MLLQTSMLTITLLVGLLTNCAPDKQAALGEEFILIPKESVEIKDTGLQLRLDKVLRSWHTDGKGETVSVEVSTTHEGREQKHYLDFKKDVTIGAFRIELLAANPFGKNECKFKVTRRE